MKVLAIALFILCLNHHVSCHPLFDFMVTALTEVANTLTNSLKTLKNKIMTLFTRDQNTVASQRGNLKPSKNKTNEKIEIKSWSDVIEKIPLKKGIPNVSRKHSNSESLVQLSTPQMITQHGRKAQTHIVLTKDGYLLTLHRIPSSFDARYNSLNSTNGTVILHHGLLGSSADWVLLGPKKSLPYLLSDAGYDVWMVNARGNYYSRSHFSLKVDSSEFWKFSWQQMGEYDLPATIEYIRTFKNSTEPINFIGHSMGATALLVLLSTKLQYNGFLRIGILLAPLAFMTNLDGPLKSLATVASNPPEDVMQVLGKDEFVPSRKMPNVLVTKYCNGSKIFCNNPLFFISGEIRQNGTWESGFIENLLQHVPAGGSTNTILHYAQVASNKKFHRFKNVDSEFPLNQITLPMAILSSTEDWLATIPDVFKLYSSIGHPIEHYVIDGKNLSHTEFVWGSDADELVFPKVMDYLKNGLNQDIYKTNDINGTV